MSQVPRSYQLFVGIDIAAASASVAWQSLAGAAPGRLDILQVPAGYDRLADCLSQQAARPGV